MTRQQPYRAFFLLGIALAAIGVMPWILFSLGFVQAYRPIFHSLVFRSMFHPLAEVEGFLTCFAVGSVFTLLPQRTGTEPPRTWQIAIGLGAPVLIVFAAALKAWPLGQLAWFLLLALLVEFAIRRIAQRRFAQAQPEVAVWLTAGLLMGVLGAGFATLGEIWGREWLWLYDLGRTLLTQGMFTGLCLGSAAMLQVRESRARGAVAVHALGAALFIATFWLGQFGHPRLAFALRASVTLAVAFQLLRAPALTSNIQSPVRATRIALWMLPIGNAWVTLSPASSRAGLHVIYLGCFTLLILVLSTQLLEWSGQSASSTPQVRAIQLWLGAGCLALALGTRILVEMDPPNFKLWLGVACACFVAATAFMIWNMTDWLKQILEIESGASSSSQRRPDLSRNFERPSRMKD